jgi:hypothetical protein
MKPVTTPQMWKLTQVLKALPLVRAILLDIREHFLENRYLSRRLAKLRAKPGRDTRKDYIAVQEAQKRIAENETKFYEAKEELETLGVFCHDVLNVVGMFPFVYSNGVCSIAAWFEYCPMGEQLYWRLDGEPEQRDVSTLDSNSYKG